MQTGYLDEFFRVYASKQAKPNVLKLAEVKDVTYILGQAFIVHLPGCELEFKRKKKLYIANYKDVISPKVQQQVCTMVQENESIYSRTDIRWAKEAYEFLNCSGYPSLDEAITLFQEGNIFGLPNLNSEDLIRAYDIYGVPVAYVRDKMTHQAIACAVIDPGAIMREKTQTLYTDIVHINGRKFLISVVEPLQLTIQAQ